MLSNHHFLVLVFLPLAWSFSLPQIDDLERQGSTDYSGYALERQGSTDYSGYALERQGSTDYSGYALERQGSTDYSGYALERQGSTDYSGYALERQGSTDYSGYNLERQGSNDYSGYDFERQGSVDYSGYNDFSGYDYSAYGDIDDEDNLDEDDFEAEFGLDPITDPEEKEKREEALWENEELVKEENEEYLEGKKTWFDKINDFADLPEDEFESEKTGELTPPGSRSFGLGLIHPPESERRDEASERYFDKFRYSRAAVPSSYDSKAQGNVSPVKSQHQCGSCVAFTNMAMIETCFKKITGVFGDYSEQQLVDCGFGKNGADGCDGAYTYSYVKWAADSQQGLVHESQYPYLNKKPNLSCPKNLRTYNQGAKVTDAHYTYEGDEETMKKLIVENGAVGTSVRASGPFSDYSGGIFAGCTSNATDHAVTAVGYGTENGVDYWLIKNSWGSDWGENGFIRIKRGVGMCGVAKVLVTVTCDGVKGATDPPLTTAKPCTDKYSNCPKLAETDCFSNSEHCRKSCGLCKGMTPLPSNTCYDKWSNCPKLAKNKCYKKWVSKECCISCGLGEGMTPAASNTCFDKWTNCAELCDSDPNDCKKSCGKC